MENDMVNRLYAIIRDRQENPKEGSYTNRLFEEGRGRIAQKVGEEGVEVVVAALSQGKERLVSELADLTYHCLVLMADAGVSPDEVREELERRHSK